MSHLDLASSADAPKDHFTLWTWLNRYERVSNDVLSTLFSLTEEELHEDSDRAYAGMRIICKMIMQMEKCQSAFKDLNFKHFKNS